MDAPGGAPFSGFVGLSVPSFPLDLRAPASAPCVEIGWRLARAFWGYGYATEAARAALAFAFETLGLAEIVSFTVPANARSRRVMEKLGMTREPRDDFDHPSLRPGTRSAATSSIARGARGPAARARARTLARSAAMSDSARERRDDARER